MRKYLLLLAGTFLGLLCCELGLRLSGIVGLDQFLHKAQKMDQPGWPQEDWFTCMQADPVLGYAPRPHRCDQDAHGHLLIPTNAPADAYRVALVGDSLLAASRLDTALVSLWPSPPPALVSMPLTGYSLWQEVRVIEHLLKTHPVKRLILLGSLNDFSTTPLIKLNSRGEFEVIPLPDTAGGQVIPSLFFSSHLYRAYWAISPALLKNSRKASIEREAAQEFERLSMALVSANAKALLLIMPRLPQNAEPLGTYYSAEEQFALSAFRSAGKYKQIETLDLHPLLARLDLPKIRDRYYSGYRDKAHPNVEGGRFLFSLIHLRLAEFLK